MFFDFKQHKYLDLIQKDFDFKQHKYLDLIQKESMAPSIFEVWNKSIFSFCS